MKEVKMIQNLTLSTLMENVAEKAQAFYDVSIILFLINYTNNVINILSHIFRSNFNVLMEPYHFTKVY